MNSENKIIKLMKVRIQAPLTIKRISEMTKINYSIVHRKVHELEKKQIISIQKVGNAKICILNRDKSINRNNGNEKTNNNFMDNLIHNNGILKKEISILLPFIKEPYNDFTLSEIKKRIGNKSHHYVYEALEKFSKTVLNKKIRGNTSLYSLNETSNNHDHLVMAELYLKESNTHIPYDTIRRIQDRIKSPFYIMLIAGSYAKNMQKRNSDIDIIIIIPNENKKPFEIALKEGELTIPEVHGFVFTEQEFLEMLTNNEFNLGKECVKNHIILYGFHSYYNILIRSLRNGFKG